MSGGRAFLTLWTLAIIASATAFAFYLAMRVRALEYGHELGQLHSHVARLREVQRVLELELASQRTPERIDLVARSLLGMDEPAPERILSAGAEPKLKPQEPASPLPPGGVP